MSRYATIDTSRLMSTAAGTAYRRTVKLITGNPNGYGTECDRLNGSYDSPYGNRRVSKKTSNRVCRYVRCGIPHPNAPGPQTVKYRAAEFQKYSIGRNNRFRPSCSARHRTVSHSCRRLHLPSNTSSNVPVRIVERYRDK